MKIKLKLSENEIHAIMFYCKFIRGCILSEKNNAVNFKTARLNCDLIVLSDIEKKLENKTRQYFAPKQKRVVALNIWEALTLILYQDFYNKLNNGNHIYGVINLHFPNLWKELTR